MTTDTATVALFGNPNPQMQKVSPVDGSRESVPAEHLSQSVTRIEFTADSLDPDHNELALSTDNERVLAMVGRSLPKDDRQFAIAVHHAELVFADHSAGVAPMWVSVPDNLDLQAALARHFGCAEGEPTNVLTEAGRDRLHEQHLKSSGQPVGHEYGALSASEATPAASDTTLAGEITTASGGLIRKKMTFAHTAGTNTSTLIETWTANGSDSLPVTIRLWANFNLAKQSEGSGKGMGEEDKLTTSATLSTSGDSITVTFTFTAG